ncbi:hypothetical protein GCM10020331_085320 [Ectobacillus funiculus]
MLGLKIVDLAPGAKYSEVLGKQECCIVAVTGKKSMSQMVKKCLKNLGTRESVFEKKYQQTVYMYQTIDVFEVEGVSQARVALCYSPSQKNNCLQD